MHRDKSFSHRPRKVISYYPSFVMLLLSHKNVFYFDYVDFFHSVKKYINERNVEKCTVLGFHRVTANVGEVHAEKGKELVRFANCSSPTFKRLNFLQLDLLKIHHINSELFIIISDVG